MKAGITFHCSSPVARSMATTPARFASIAYATSRVFENTQRSALNASSREVCACTSTTIVRSERAARMYLPFGEIVIAPVRSFSPSSPPLERSFVFAPPWVPCVGSPTSAHAAEPSAIIIVIATPSSLFMHETDGRADRAIHLFLRRCRVLRIGHVVVHGDVSFALGNRVHCEVHVVSVLAIRGERTKGLFAYLRGGLVHGRDLATRAALRHRHLHRANRRRRKALLVERRAAFDDEVRAEAIHGHRRVEARVEIGER